MAADFYGVDYSCVSVIGANEQPAEFIKARNRPAEVSTRTGRPSAAPSSRSISLLNIQGCPPSTRCSRPLRRYTFIEKKMCIRDSVHRKHPPVALRHPRRAPKLLRGRVAVRLVHQPQRNAARARLQRGGQPMQQENLKNGKEITIVNEELNKAAKVKLDLNARNGLSIKDANTIEIKATEKKEQTIGKERYKMCIRDRQPSLLHFLPHVRQRI